MTPMMQTWQHYYRYDRSRFGGLRLWLLFRALPALLGAGVFLLLMTHIPAQAANGDDPRSEPGTGVMWLQERGGPGLSRAVSLDSAIHVSVSGMIATVTIEQAFRNDTSGYVEGVYAFPMSDNAAVRFLEMEIGERRIVGKVREKEEASRLYDAARREGKKASLVEQQRPNLFTNRVANIGPGETIRVRMEYVEPVRLAGEVFSLRLPTTLTARYMPGRIVGEELTEEGPALRINPYLGWAANTDEVPDAAAISPTQHRQAGSDIAPINPLVITATLDMGMPLASVESPYHDIALTRRSGVYTLALSNGPVEMDRDFELRWSAAGEAPSLGLFRQGHGELDYVMATITPPSAGPSGQVPPREMIFVIDNSGSMAGGSMDAARRSLLYALETLRPEDRFNIIRFDDTMEMLFPASALAKGRDLQRAISFTHGLDAQGGTEMLPALRAALLGSAADAAIEAAECAEQTLERRPSDMQGQCSLPVRQVIFLTDGSLSNEAAMMEEINRRRDRSRVFMVGIGSAPNSYLMRRMAEAGRGTFTHIGNGNEAESQMQRLLDRLAQPVATNLTAYVEGGNLRLTPRELPDLYAGEPLVLLGRTRHLEGTLVVSGTINGSTWTQRIDLDEATRSPSVAKLWAYRRIAEVEAERWSGEMSYELADMAIEELGMDFHLVTTRTSLIAVDETPTRPVGAGLRREELPLILPAGWDFDTLFPARSLSSGRSDPMSDAEHKQRLELPNTSTGYFATLQLGLALFLTGLMGLAWWRRERLLPEAFARRLQREAI